MSGRGAANEVENLLQTAKQKNIHRKQEGDVKEG